MKSRIAGVLSIVVLSSLLLIAPAGASKKSEAAKLFRHDYNVYLVNDYNLGIHKQNESNPSTMAAGIREEVTAINQFDNKLRTIKFPSSDRSALNQVLTDDEVQASLDGTLALNTSNTNVYNSLLTGIVTAEANSTSVINALARKLGMNWN